MNSTPRHKIAIVPNYGKVKYFIAENGEYVITSSHGSNLGVARALYRHLFIGKRVRCGFEISNG